MNTTNEFSFVLKPSEHGIGVFAVHDIEKGTYLRLFGEGDQLNSRSVLRDPKNVPDIFKQYCMHRDNGLVAPRDFGEMAVGWYLNHSTTPNAVHKEFNWYADCDIKEGEEILIDYNSLEEPEESREEYYKNTGAF